MQILRESYGSQCFRIVPQFIVQVQVLVSLVRRNAQHQQKQYCNNVLINPGVRMYVDVGKESNSE